MKRVEIRVNGYALDLKGDEVIPSSFAVHSLDDGLDSRNGYFSTNFTIPNTGWNKLQLGLPNDLNSFDRTAYKKVRTEILENGGLVVQGTLQVVEYNAFIVIKIEGGNSDVINFLMQHNINELDFSAYDHEWTLANVLATENNTWEDVYTYPAINFGGLDNRDYNYGLTFSELLPCLFVRPVVEQLLSRFGYSLSGSFVDNYDYNRMVIVNPKPLQYDEVFIRERASFVGIRNVNNIQGDATVLTGDNPYSKILPFNTDYLDPYYDGKADNYNPGSYRYKADKAMYVNVEVAAAFFVNVSVGKAKYKFYLLKNDEVFINWEQSFKAQFFGNTQKAVPANKTIPNVLLLPGDTLKVKLEINRDGASAAYQIVLQPLLTTLKITPQAIVPPGGQITLNSCLPDMLQKDLIKTLVNQFNLLLITDTNTQTVYLEYFSLNTQNMMNGNHVDMSSKVRFEEPPQIKYLQDGYAQINIFGYKEDETDKAAKGYGNGQFEIRNEHLAESATIFDSYFSPTQSLSAINGSSVLPYIPLFKPKDKTSARPYDPDATYSVAKDNSTQDFALHNSLIWKARKENVTGVTPGNNDEWVFASFDEVYETLEPNVRLLVKDEFNSNPVNIVDPTEDINYPFVNNYSFERLRFDTHLLPHHYSGLIKALQDGKYLRALFRLNAVDVVSLDFTKPWYIKCEHPDYAQSVNGYFYVSLVDQYQHGTALSTWVDLLKLSPESTPVELPDEKDVFVIGLVEGGYLLTQSNDYIPLQSQPVN